ncbi:MAG: YlxM family DNA-binding protein [Firmicutes bacterium]|nr:YlxM family DNA-binding protein [Bacillota bacterium]
MDEFVRMAVLADVYGPLLTDNQRKVVELHYGEDLSLGEIAEQFGISRAAVHDTLRRAQHALEEYEAAIGFVSREEALREAVRSALDALSEAESGRSTADEAISRVRRILERMFD